MIIRTSKQEIKDYFDNETHINQGALKKLLGGVRKFKEAKEKKLFYEEEEHFVIGSAVDVKLTQGEEIFKEEFYISMLTDKPSDTVMSIIQEVFQTLLETRTDEEISLLSGSLSLFPDLITSACANHNWNNRWGDEAKIRAITDQGVNYFNELVKANGKQVITLEEAALIDNIVYTLKNHPVTKYLFEDSDNYVIIYQKPLYFAVEGVMCKALPDIILIDKQTNIIHCFDIKTTGDELINFPYNAAKLRYDIQAAFYMEAIKRTIDSRDGIFSIEVQNGEGVPPSLYEFPIASIAGFSFVVASKIDTSQPVIYTASQDFYFMGKYGREELAFKANEEMPKLSFGKVHGFMDLIHLYDWHCKNGFETDFMISTNENVLPLNWNVRSLYI